MTTKIIPRSSLMKPLEISGTIKNPEIFPLTPGEIYHAAIVDFGEFAVFESARSINMARTDYENIVLNGDNPTLDLKDLKTLKTTDREYYFSYQKFEFTKAPPGKERG